MSNLPLYDNLMKETTNDDLTTKQKDNFMKLIKSVDQNGAELVYALIRMYQLENDDDKSTFKIPYGGKYIKSDMTFNLIDLPNQLKQVLFKFLQLHTETMKEKEDKEKQ